MNKLLFILERDSDDIILIANNYKDLEEHLQEIFYSHKVNVIEKSVVITDSLGDKEEAT